MSQSSFKHRGQVSLLTLVLTTMLVYLALGQLHFAKTALQGSAPQWDANQNTQALNNALHEVRIAAGPVQGTAIENGQNYAYWRQFDRVPGLAVERVDLVFENHDHWPRPSALWVELEGFGFRVVDFRAAGDP